MLVAIVVQGPSKSPVACTSNGHPTSRTAGLANLEVIERDHLVERVRDDVGPYFQKKLQFFAGHPAIGEVRGYGLIGALELLPREGKSALTPTTMLGIRGAKLAREEGVIPRGLRDLRAVAPPLIITHGEIDQLFVEVEKAVERLWG